MLKLAWSIGHDPAHPGAYSEYLKESEHPIASEVVRYGIQEIKKRNLAIDIFIPNDRITKCESKSAGEILREKIHLINTWKADIAIESHFNSAGFSAQGCETIYFALPGFDRFSVDGKILAEQVQAQTLFSLMAIPERFIRDRGAIGMASIRRIYNGKETFARFAFLMNTHMPAIITEPLFISNETDSFYLKTDRQNEIHRLALGVVNGVVEWANMKGLDLSRDELGGG